MDNAKFKIPEHPPMSKEEYRYCFIFSEIFPSDSATKFVPSVKSVACSTPESLAWDVSFQNVNDPSGRAVKALHKDGDK
jgi:asparagine synthase (glutamine-hydrolysing)